MLVTTNVRINFAIISPHYCSGKAAATLFQIRVGYNRFVGSHPFVN